MSAVTAHGIRLRSGTTALNHRALRAVGGWMPRLSAGWMPWLEHATYELPIPPGDGWVQLRTILSGVCGSDLGLLTGRTSAILSPFASFPAVLGHEILAVVEDGPPGLVGRRVAVDPLISCTMRGLQPCSWCAARRPALCLNAAKGSLAPGPMIGFCSDLPGGWADRLVAHVSQLHPLPDTIPDAEGVLIEPLSVAMHAVLDAPAQGADPALVIGGGALGLCTVAALRMRDPELDITVVARHPAQADLASRLGATRVLRDGAGLAEQAAQPVHASVYRDIYGQPVLAGGYPRVIDAVGTAKSMGTAISLAAAGGHISVVGGPGRLADLDWTLVWTRELRVAGHYVYGAEPALEGLHTFDHVIDLLAQRPGLPLAEIVTHRFGLAGWRHAMAAAIARGRHRALKIVFDPTIG